MSQLSYEPEMEKGLEGLPFDANNLDAISRLCEGADLLLGRAVQLGTDKDEQIKAAAAGMTLAQFKGLMRYRPLVDGVVLDKSAQTIITKGRVWVVPAETVEPGDECHIVLAAGTYAAEEIGRLVKTADGSNTLDISEVAKWERGGAAQDLAVVSIDL